MESFDNNQDIQGLLLPEAKSQFEKKRNSSQALDKLRGEIDTVAPHDCTSLNFEIFEQVQVRKLLNNRSVIILDTALRGKFFNFPHNRI